MRYVFSFALSWWLPPSVRICTTFVTYSDREINFAESACVNILQFVGKLLYCARLDHSVNLLFFNVQSVHRVICSKRTVAKAVVK